MSSQQDHRLEAAMGRMLQVGVTISALIVTAGGILYLSNSGGLLADYQHFHGAPAAEESVHGILGGLRTFDGGSLIELGILLLIATPICRVLFGVAGFSLLKDNFYASISAIVLIILLLSFFIRR